MRVARFGFVECGGCRVLGLPILAVSEFGGYVVLGLRSVGVTEFWDCGV